MIHQLYFSVHNLTTEYVIYVHTCLYVLEHHLQLLE